MEFLVNMVRFYPFFLVLCVSCLMSCQKVTKENVNETLQFNLGDAEKMDLPDFLDSITITPLQTNDSTLIMRPKSLEYVNGVYFINDNQNFVYIFSKEGECLFSTTKFQGYGPNQYTDCISSFIHNNKLGIFDALKYKIWLYDLDNENISEINLAKEILPAFNCLMINNDLIAFEDVSFLKIYSIKKGRIIQSIPVPYQKGMRITSNPGLRKINERILYSSIIPENTLYELDTNNECLNPILSFDFNNHNFILDNILKGQSPTYYHKLMMSNNKYTFISDKYIMNGVKCCFFIHDKRMYFALHIESQNKNKIYYNSERQRGQLMIPHFCNDNIFYYLCEPSLIDYVVDEKLMKEESIKILRSIKEDDNPVIIKYFFKI